MIRIRYEHISKNGVLMLPNFQHIHREASAFAHVLANISKASEVEDYTVWMESDSFANAD